MVTEVAGPHVNSVQFNDMLRGILIVVLFLDNPVKQRREEI